MLYVNYNSVRLEKNKRTHKRGKKEKLLCIGRFMAFKILFLGISTVNNLYPSLGMGMSYPQMP